MTDPNSRTDCKLAESSILYRVLNRSMMWTALAAHIIPCYIYSVQSARTPFNLHRYSRDIKGAIQSYLTEWRATSFPSTEGSRGARQSYLLGNRRDAPQSYIVARPSGGGVGG